MKEILFRGKTKNRKENEWIEGSFVTGKYLYDHTPVAFIYETDTYIDGRGCIGNYHGEEVDPETVGQFSGVMDYKDEVKIFSGDIIKDIAGDTGELFEVKYDINLAAFIFRNPINDSWDYLGYGVWEVVGNIYDDPDAWEVE